MAALLAYTAAFTLAATQQIDVDTFHNEVIHGGRVWVVIFDVVGSGEAHDAAAKLKEEAGGGWLSVGWLDVGSDVEARIIAEVNGAGGYPFVKAFNGEHSFDASISKLTLQNAIEKWLPDRLPHPTLSTLRHVLPESPSTTADCQFAAPTTAPATQLALLRASAMKFWGSLTSSLAYHANPEITVSCKDKPELKIEDAAKSDAYEKIIEYIGQVSPRKAVHRAAQLEKLREEAATDAALWKVLVPQLRTTQQWNEIKQDERGYFDVVFALDKTAKKFDAHREVALGVTKKGGGSTAKKVAFSFWWVDTSTESVTALQGGLSIRKQAPSLIFILSAKGQTTPDGPMKMTRAVLPYTGAFTTKAISRFIETSLLSGEGLVPLQLEYVKGFSGDSDEDLIDAEPVPLTLKEDKAKLAEDRKEKQKPKKKTKKQLEKEAQKLEKVKDELAAKKAAREQRIKEKKEREAAEKEAKKKELEEKKRKRKEEEKGMTKEEIKKKREAEAKQKKEEEKKRKREAAKKKREERKKKKEAEKKKSGKDLEKERKKKEKEAEREKKKKEREEKLAEKKAKQAEWKAKHAEKQKLREEAKKKLSENKKKREEAKKNKLEREEARRKEKEGDAEVQDPTQADPNYEPDPDYEPDPVDLSKMSPEDFKKFMRRKEREKRRADKKLREAAAKWKREQREKEEKEKAAAKKERDRYLEEMRQRATAARLKQEREWADEDGEDVAIEEEL